MDVRVHEIADRGKHRSMPRERRQAAKRFRDDAHPEMPLTAGRPRVTDVV